MKTARFSMTVTITILMAFAALAVPKAQAYMTRGIYVNDQVHYFSVGADSKHQTLSHQAGTMDSSTQLLTLGTAVTESLSSCTPDDGAVNMNGAVFDNKIFFVFTGNPECKTKPATGDTHLYVATWDLTNNTFVPTNDTPPQPVKALGVGFKLNGYTWSSSQADGRWSRRGKVWTFTTRRRVKKDVVALKLDFDKKSWSLDLSRTDLSPFFRVSEGKVHVELNVNGKYELYYDCDHDVETQWEHIPVESASEGHALSLTRYKGFFYTSTGIGVAVLEGNLPPGLQHFGDISFMANGRQADVPLLSHRNYARALARGDKLVINRKGLQLSLDFGQKKWRVDFYGKIDPRWMPRSTATTIQVKVGGQVWYSGKHPVRDYTSRIEYVNPDPT